MFTFDEDRSKFPEKNPDGTNKIDLESGRFTQIWQGPVHPGMTGNMAVELIVQGDEIMSCKTHVGYLHRGFEKLMERRRFIQCLPICVRICVPEPDFNEYCLCSTVEELSGIEVPDAALWMRTLLLEMARLQSYLVWLGGIGGALGMGVVGQWTTYARDLILDRFEEITGGRIYHMHMMPGGVRSLTPEGFEKRMTENLDEIMPILEDTRTTMFQNSVFKTRTVGVGYIDPNMVNQYGITGPNARAAGILRDVRVEYPYLKYGELDFEPSLGKDSDIYTRAWVRYQDTLTSIDLIRQIIAKMPKKGPFMADVPNVLH